VVREVENLSSKYKAPNSNFSIEKKRGRVEWGGRKNNGSDEPIQCIIHVYMEMSQ
jgi:hypothetical protein